MRSLITALAFCVLFARSAMAGDEIILHSGKKIIGETVSAEGADPVRVKVQDGSIKATISYPASSIKSISRGVNQRSKNISDIRDHLHQFAETPMVNNTL